MAFKAALRKDIGKKRGSAADKAKIMMMRNDSYSELVLIMFPHHIRLPIHDHSSTEKISVHLVGNSIITPWHGVAVKQKDRTWAIMRKKTALEMGCILEDAMSPENREDILYDGEIFIKIYFNLEIIHFHHFLETHSTFSLSLKPR